MTGINRALFEDERTCQKSVIRFIQYGEAEKNPTSSTYIPDDPNVEDPTIVDYYCANTLYFLNSTNNMTMEVEVYDFLENSEDPENLISINSKRSVKIPVTGLGIPANFTRTIEIHPSFQVVGEYGTEYGEVPVPVGEIEGISTYQVVRDNLGISEWERDIGESTGSIKNQALFSQYKRSWLGRLHGDIIDMAFYVGG